MPQRSDHQDTHTRTERRSVRTATPQDLPFIDDLQKTYSNNVGFLPGPALIQYVHRRSILIVTEDATPVGYLLGRHSLAWQPLLRPIYQLCIHPAAHGRQHAAALIEAWQNLAKLTNQIGIQANCSAALAAHTFWPAQGFKFICHLRPTNARHRDIIVWRKPLTTRLPPWFIYPPQRAGHRAQRTGAK